VVVVDVASGGDGTTAGWVVGVRRVEGAIAVGQPVQMLLQHRAHLAKFPVTSFNSISFFLD